MFDLFTDMPLLVLFLKFMIASTLLIGSVWAMEKIGLIKSPDLAELAWKLSILGSFVALLPVGDWISRPITIEHSQAAEIVRQFDEARPLAQDETTAPFSEREIPDFQPGLEGVTPYTTQSDITSAGLSRQDATTGPVTDSDVIGNEVIGSEANTIINNDLSDGFWQSVTALRTKDLALLLWGILASVAALFLVVAYVGAIRSLGSRTRVDAEHPANQTLRAICERADIRHVPYLSRSADIKSPVCLPRKEICLPDWAFDDLPQEELNSLLAHEVAHMVRRDPLMLMLLQAMSRLFFFQPLFMLARKRLTDIAELSADEWAATRYANAHSVAAALYTCATKINENRQIQWGLAMAGNKSMLKVRVERLIGSDTAPFRKTGIGAKAAVTASLLTITLGLPSIQFADALYAPPPFEEEAYGETLLAAAHPHPQDAWHDDKVSDKVRDAVREAVEKARVHAERARADAINKAPSAEEIREIVRDALRVAAEEAKLHANAVRATLPDEAEIEAQIREAVAEVEARAEEIAREAAIEAERAIAEMDSFAMALPDEGRPTHRHITSADGSGNMVWSDGDREVKARWDGEFQLTDDDRNIKSMDRDGMLELRTKEDGEKHKIRIENPDGTLEYRYWKNGRKTDFDDEGKEWLADTLLLMVREIGLNAEARVARILENDGTKAVVREIETIESDYVARIYSSHLVDQADLSAGQVEDLVDRFAKMDGDYDMRLALTTLLNEKGMNRKVLPKVLKAAKSIDSDYEMRLLLSPYIDRFGLDDRATGMLLDLAADMESDYELRLLLTGALADKKMNQKNLEKFTEIAAKNIESDYELRLLLSAVAKQFGSSEKATSTALEAIRHIDSDYEKRLALSSLLDHGAFDKGNWELAIEIASSMDGDYEKRLALTSIKRRLPDDSKLQKAFREAVASIDSDYERELIANSDTAFEIGYSIATANATPSANAKASAYAYATAHSTPNGAPVITLNVKGPELTLKVPPKAEKPAAEDDKKKN